MGSSCIFSQTAFGLFFFLRTDLFVELRLFTGLFFFKPEPRNIRSYLTGEFGCPGAFTLSFVTTKQSLEFYFLLKSLADHKSCML